MPAISAELQKKIKSWTWIQSLPFDVLKSLTNEQLALTVGKNMGTLGQQFLHMINVRHQYAAAVEARKVAARPEIDRSMSKSVAALMEAWDQANTRVIAAIQNASDETQIDWTYWGLAEMNIHDHFNVLMDHETLHSGQIIVYLRTHEIPFPESWKAWGLI
jgi:uncharacterized damage-inducible protein DinB